MSLFRNNKGFIAVEFALTFPIMLLLLFLVIGFGLHLVKDQMAVNAVGNISDSLKTDPTNSSIKTMAYNSGSSLVDYNPTRPGNTNYICAKAYQTYDQAAAGMCSGTEWVTTLPGQSSYYIAVKAHAKKNGMAMVDKFLSDINESTIVQVSQVGIPSGAVMAFDLAACPAGWTAFVEARGRNIIGTGLGTSPSASNYTLKQVGGKETHILTVAQMPSHNHKYQHNDFRKGSVSGNGPQIAVAGADDGTAVQGGGQAHPIMDPYIALLYCKKL